MCFLGLGAFLLVLETRLVESILFDGILQQILGECAGYTFGKIEVEFIYLTLWLVLLALLPMWLLM